jgi:hypothetical protein
MRAFNLRRRIKLGRATLMKGRDLACATIQGFAAGELTTEAKDLLDESLRMIGSRKMSFRDLKDLVYESRYFARTSSHTLYTGARKRSNLGRKPSSQEQCQTAGTMKCAGGKASHPLLAAPTNR